MPHSAPDAKDAATLKYIVTHVFCPLQLPDGDDDSICNDLSLATAVVTAADVYSEHVDQANLPQWQCILRMLENLQSITQSKRLSAAPIISQFSNMDDGDFIALPIRAQNAGVLIRKQEDVTIFESFELSPRAQDVMATEGKLVCSYPGPAIEIPNLVFDDVCFRSELANFLVHMNHDNLDASANGAKERSSGFKDTVHPRYITELLTGILRSVGRPADIPRISKRIGDDAVCNHGSKLPWRRSPLWLLTRVALQTTLDRSPLGHDTYKKFMLFFMCHLADENTYRDFPADLLHFMSAKISRRLCKLGSSAPRWLSHTVLETCTSLRSTMEDRWQQVQATQRQSPVWNPSQLDLSRDIQLSLSHSEYYLRNSLANHSISPPETRFNPKHRPQGTLDDFLSSDGAFFEEAYRVQPRTTLYGLERAVEHGIDAWVGQVANNDDASVKLEILANKYSSCASNTYANNPELLSVMMLTTIELWIALDKIAIKEIPFLADYSPEVPTSLLENLLLCKTASLNRVRSAHHYLSHRHSKSRSQLSVFSSITTADSFAVRFYRKSLHLRNIKAAIEDVARRQVREKIVELQSRNALHSKLGGATASWIRVHEWPLPANEIEAEAVVFELDCPVAFNMWRTATLHLMVDLSSPSTQQHDGSRIRPGSYEALAPYLVRHPRSRVVLSSRTWPFATSVELPARKKRVCIKNSVTFSVLDVRTGVVVSQALVRSPCRGYTYKLESGPYHGLQRFIDSTSHTSNEVIAGQGECHKDLSIHEYMAFGHLRSGGFLQWLNILRELRARSLNFRRNEVHMLLAQAVSQIGPITDAGLMWHREIEEPTFCYALLRELEHLIQDVEANWKEGVTMDTISLLLRRLIASSPDQAVSLEGVRLLRTLRDKVFSWVQELSAVLVRAPGNGEFRGVLRDTAAICRGTFDVDPTLVPNLLHSAEDIEVLLSCAIIIHDHIPSDLTQLPAYSQLLLDRDRRASKAFESILSDMIQSDQADHGIKLAVSRIWPDYHPGSKWSTLHDSDTRWLICTTAPPAGQRPQMVHLNVLNGSLLIDGTPLGTWLPNKFMCHPLYKGIFGEQMLQVMPSDVPGMDYCTRHLISEHQVHFYLRKRDSELFIRAKRKGTHAGHSDLIELIPHEKLEGDLPAVLIEGHVHWLNLSTSVVDIRPLDSIWEDSSEHWRIDFTTGRYRMQKGDESLLDIRSQTWGMISSLLRPLCSPRDLIVSVSPVEFGQPWSSLQLTVVLPSYGLTFFVDQDGELQSRNMRGMVYDENQSIGTFFGLVNRLVLRPKIGEGKPLDLIPRSVIIPDGDVSVNMHRHHVCVEITPHRSGQRRVTYQTYKVNTDIGSLTGNPGLTSNLYCAYLHALTSGCGIDPLTGRSGTEEALSVLGSGVCWSAIRFGPRDAELLSLIAAICPLRTWYPKQPVQKVTWRKLPRNSQNHELFLLSKAIKEHYERLRAVYENSSSLSFQHFPLQNNQLLMRSARRAAYLFPVEVSGQYSRNFDVRYSGRDVVEVASGESRAYTAATYVYSRHATNTVDMWSMVESWGQDVSGDGGPVSEDLALSLRFNRSWLAPNLPKIWLKVYNLLRKGDETKWPRMLFSLPSMAYSSPDLSKLVPVLVAFASLPEFCSEDPPRYGSYPIAQGFRPDKQVLQRCVMYRSEDFEYSPEYSEHKKFGEGGEKLRQRQLRMFVNRIRSDAEAEVQRFLGAWPCETLPPCSLDPYLYNLAGLQHDIRPYFFARFRNLKLKEHLTRVQAILDNIPSPALPIPDTTSYSFPPSQSFPPRVPWRLTIDQLFARPAPLLQTLSPHRLPRCAVDAKSTSELPRSTPLHQLISTVEASTENPFQRQYVSNLRTSVESFESEAFLVDYEATNLPTAETLMEHYVKCKASYAEAFSHLQRHLGPRCESEEAVEQAGQWLRVTSYTLYRFLASNSSTIPPDDWKRCFVTFALIALELQKARRLLLLYFNNLFEDLWRELQNEGCDGWNAEAHPDWLLIQLQGDFLIRRVQAEVANEMISPSSGENTAMQLNMGEGKTFVIVPISAVVLANGAQLVRVIVPKPLTMQTIHLLVDRLGGLTNRRIYYLPFSRSLEINNQMAFLLRLLMLKCMRERAILVVQPEHIQSLKLVSVEKQLSREEERPVAYSLAELQRWLHSHSRDVLDESDEILDARAQLLFTYGHQERIEGSPERWTITEQVLSLVSKHAFSLRELFPLGIEYQPGPPGSFPYLRVLHTDAGESLISRIAQDVIESGLPNINFGHLHFHTGLKDAIQSFVSCEDVSRAEAQLVKKHFGKTSLWGSLLLLRGLLANDIVLFALRERRWRVDYGLSPTRTMLAVPYRAKDVPAQRAEFGHPDISIVLTYLSYYYAGLSEDDLKISFGILFKLYDPSVDYDLWLRDCSSVPESLRTLSGVNIESAEQWNKFLFPLFSRNRATINFYLSNVVFPREAKEFPSKLSSSGWDLAEKKERLLTGFSGTNDGQYLLPLHITQRDPEHQRGTNAKVLSYLLQPENNHYMCMNSEHSNRPTTHEFLKILVAQKPEIRVLLDVGAQMLDLQNHELAKVWLDIVPDASAAVYFNQEDELTVCTEDGSTQLLLASPYAEQLDRCVIYLDDAHTRGTDIKLPIGFRAAVTLGPKVTKDRLAQGCMRMRKLGRGHSVVFFAPLTVDQRIRSVASKGPLDVINTTDILHWAIRESWEYIRRWAPHWVQQGMDHTSRYTAWNNFCKFQITSEELSDHWLQREAKRLEDLYEPCDLSMNPTLLTQTSPDIHQRCVDLGVLSLRSVGMDEEQEREVVREVIREREVERRSSRVLPANHSIHQEVVDFIRTGVIHMQTNFSGAQIQPFGPAFSPAFKSLDATSAANNEAFIWGQSVLVTTDFRETVTVQASETLDDYLRPVHWIISAKKDSRNIFVILSPYEVNALLPDIRSSNKVHLHLYTPRITKTMKLCDDLGLYSIPAVPDGWIIPSSLMDQLNVFAGQLYLKDYETYIRLCRFLWVYARDLEGAEGNIVVEPDGFILPKNRKGLVRSRPEMGHTFAFTPLVAIKALMNLRGKGIDVSSTHMGKIIHGRLLSEDDFDDGGHVFVKEA